MARPVRATPCTGGLPDNRDAEGLELGAAGILASAARLSGALRAFFEPRRRLMTSSSGVCQERPSEFVEFRPSRSSRCCTFASSSLTFASSCLLCCSHVLEPGVLGAAELAPQRDRPLERRPLRLAKPRESLGRCDFFGDSGSLLRGEEPSLARSA